MSLLKFKNTVQIFLVVSVIGLSASKAEAGLLIGSAAGNPGKGAVIGASVGAAIFVGNWVAYESVSDPGVVLGLYTAFFFSVPLMGVLTLLDVDAHLSENSIALGLQKAFPQIDNFETIAKIARASKDKLALEARKHPESNVTFIRFSDMEITNLLADSDLGPSEFAQIREKLL